MKRTIIAAVASGLVLGEIVAGANRKPLRAKRGGFTLVELLVVIGIISFMVAMLFRVGLSVVSFARESASKTVLQKVHKALNQRNEAFIRKWGGSDRSTIARLHNTQEWHEARNFVQINGNPVTDSQRLILTRKLLYSRYNPSSKSDLLGPPWRLPADKVANMDNAEILFYMLVEAPQFSDVALTIDAFSNSEVRDTDGDSNFEFTDSWGTPVHWWKWLTPIYFEQITNAGAETEPHQTYTTGIIPTMANQRDLKHDPADPLGEMHNVKDFSALFHNPGTYTLPVVMSAGPDGNFGIDDAGKILTPWNYDPTVTDAENIANRRDPIDDNISAVKIRAGGN